MRVLRLVVFTGLALCLLGVTGCSQFDKSLGQQQALVSFNDNTPNSVRMQVRDACGKLPGVTPSPIPPGVSLNEALSEVVYQINNADDADIARLEECLQKYPSVTGINIQDSSDND
ncbi:MAG TPA: hypothetical protein VG142_02295 [Trebonia sp.]|jgi:hypothetical protein|nr:hypothetical protein [Trebonia sp.]